MRNLGAAFSRPVLIVGGGLLLFLSCIVCSAAAMIVFGGIPPGITVINHSGEDLVIDAGGGVRKLPAQSSMIVPYRRNVSRVQVATPSGRVWKHPPLFAPSYKCTPNDCFQLEPDGELYWVSNTGLGDGRPLALVNIPPQPAGFPIPPGE
jgi:hypothetical protein